MMVKRFLKSRILCLVLCVVILITLLPFRYFDGGRLYSELKGREVGTAVKAASLLPLACIGVYSVLNGKLPLSLIAAVILILLDGRS